MFSVNVICDICGLNLWMKSKKLPSGWHTYSIMEHDNGSVKYAEAPTFHVCLACAPTKEVTFMQKIFKWWFRKEQEPLMKVTQKIIDQLRPNND